MIAAKPLSHSEGFVKLLIVAVQLPETSPNPTHIWRPTCGFLVDLVDYPLQY